MSTNPITGDRLTSGAVTDSYREGYDAIFGKKESAMQAIELPEGLRQARQEARLYCDEHGLTDLADLDRVMGGMAYRAFLRDIEPLIDLKAKLLQHKVPKIVLGPAGELVTTEYEFSEVEKQAMNTIDEMIGRVAESYGLSPREAQ